MYRARYFKDPIFEAIDIIKPACEQNGITMAQAALRWLQHHSELKEQNGDAIIIGASSLNHIEQNLVDLEGAPLPQAVIDALDKAWKAVLDGGAAPPYHH